MIKRLCVILPATALSLMLAGCGNEKKVEASANRESGLAKKAAPATAAHPKTSETPKNPNEVVASVNGKRFLRKEMDQAVSAMLKHYKNKIPAAQLAGAREEFGNRAVYSFIMKNIFLNEAQKKGITINETDRTNQLAKLETALKTQKKTIDQFFRESPLGEKAARKEFEDSLLIHKLIDTNVLSKIVVPDADIKAKIDTIKKENEKIALRNKNIDSEKKKARARIDAIKKRLDNGEDFGEIAKNESECPSSKKNGDLGSFARGQMVKPFEDAAFSQEIGKVGNVVETKFGYHLIKVTGKTPAVAAKGNTPAQPEKVTASHILIKTPQLMVPRPIPTEAEVREQLKQSKSRAAVRDYADRLKKAAKIETSLPKVRELLK